MAYRGSVEETLNALLQKEADELCQARRYERKLETEAGEVTLRMPKLRPGPVRDRTAKPPTPIPSNAPKT